MHTVPTVGPALRTPEAAWSVNRDDLEAGWIQQCRAVVRRGVGGRGSRVLGMHILKEVGYGSQEAVSCQCAGEHRTSCLNMRVHAEDVKLKYCKCAT